MPGIKLKINFENLITQVAIIFSIVSFSSNERISSICSMLMYGFWALSACRLLYKKQLSVNKFSKTLLTVFVFAQVWFRLMYWLGFYPSGGAGAGSYLWLCFIFYTLGLNNKADDVSIKSLIFAFFIGQVILMALELPIITDADFIYYQYSRKNQMGQMFGAGAIISILAVSKIYKSKLWKVMCYAMGGLLIISVATLRSRTPLIAILAVSVIFFISKKDKKFKDYILAAAVVSCAAVVIGFFGGTDYLKELFELEENTSLVESSLSGRNVLFADGLKDFISSPIWGVGGYAYVDNFIIFVLRSGGILWAIILFPIAYGKLFSATFNGIKVMRNSSEGLNIAYATILVLSLFYIVISLMEGYPPLGPGKSIFFLWTVLGIYDKITADKYSCG